VIEMRSKLPWRKDGVRQGATPQSVARAAIDALERGRSEIIPSFAGKLLVLLNRLAPRLVDRWMRRYS
jgi:short-subunit dehydrogenase